MGERQTSIAAVRERLTGLLADWGAELSVVLKELEERRAEADAAARLATEQARELEAKDHETARLVATLESSGADVERLKSELDSKQELLRALRRDAEGAERLRSELKIREQERDALAARAERAEQRVAGLELELQERVEAAEQSGSDASELEALRAELEARKALIKSLRADQERSVVLQADLDEKREVIRQLEGTISRHSDTIAELKRSVDVWKTKYRAVQHDTTISGSSTIAGNTTIADAPAVAGSTTTTVASGQMPAFTEEELRALERDSGSYADATIAIDMRRSLLEARRVASARGREK